ncbi:unnamed protein product [Linum trigynum]|uniref:Uncharacterized protein n=1 Tax=Linum trigynum TaxID=586398 RepID=A0AAV2CRT7_9ROSI
MFTFLIPFYSFYQPYQSNISTAVSRPDFGDSQVSKARGLIVVVSTLGDGYLEGGSLVQAATLILKIISAKFISFEWIDTFLWSSSDDNLVASGIFGCSEIV